MNQLVRDFLYILESFKYKMMKPWLLNNSTIIEQL